MRTPRIVSHRLVWIARSNEATVRFGRDADEDVGPGTARTRYPAAAVEVDGADRARERHERHHLAAQVLRVERIERGAVLPVAAVEQVELAVGCEQKIAARAAEELVGSWPARELVRVVAAE
jgi:hypothetical protein